MTTEADRTARLQALQARRGPESKPKRRRPAEASRILAAGAGTAAMLSLVTVMATSDAAAAPPPLSEPTSAAAGSGGVTTLSPRPIPAVNVDHGQVDTVASAETVTVVRVARPQSAVNGRTHGSR